MCGEDSFGTEMEGGKRIILGLRCCFVALGFFLEELNKSQTEVEINS